MSRYTVCVDFDGVIHDNTAPFNPDAIEGDAVPGAIRFLIDMALRFDVVIHTTRAKDVPTRVMVERWLNEHGLPSGFLLDDEIRVSNIKPPALIYIDDRAYRFTGANWPTAKEIHALRPWNKPAEATE